MSIGIHIIADLRGVEFDRISNVDDIKKVMEGAVKAGNLTKIRSHYHQFTPTGVSGIILIAESHLSFHTWPEYGLVTLDIFTCGPTDNAETAFEYILDKLSPQSVEYKKLERGVDYPRGSQKKEMEIGIA
ncbi:MAG: adenosylmethionine decarboxylase [Candidatus Thermoplasmatota archaeon]|jgi:S-adenosylmethionine decarboxylase|nr:adenosylmethionine decarboxylase [Candidatus Thermoplasmatota archaeon]